MTEQERIDIAYLDTGVYENPWRENLFETLPEDRKTAEVCRFAIKKSAFNIEFVPEAMKTPELCLAAAGHRGETLKFVPDRLKTPKMCRAAGRFTYGRNTLWWGIENSQILIRSQNNG